MTASQFRENDRYEDEGVDDAQTEMIINIIYNEIFKYSLQSSSIMTFAL